MAVLFVYRAKKIMKKINKRLKKSGPWKHFIKKDTVDIITVVGIVGIATLLIILYFLKRFMEPLTSTQQVQWTSIVAI
jgi:hypothetical protein